VDAAGDADRARRARRDPTEPYESALIDGASFWQMFRYITLPLITPFLFIAAMIRMIDAVKSFDIISRYARRAGSARDHQPLSLQRRLRLLRRRLRLGDRVVFFVLIVALAAVMLYFRQRITGTRPEAAHEPAATSLVKLWARSGSRSRVFCIVSPRSCFSSG